MSLQPEFFDIFGMATFTFIIILSSWAMKSKKPLPKWSSIILLIIGIVGFLIDGTIVYNFYLK